MTVKLIIGVYFLGILLIGLFSYFRIKDAADFFVAGKKAGISAVAGSLLSTILGGSAILGTIELSRKTGWPALWFLFCAVFGLLALLPLSKYVKRYGNYTLPEMLGRFYGKKVENLAAIVIPVAWIGIVAAQVIAAAQIINGLGIMGYRWGAVVSGFIFIGYTLAGGQLSILKTDRIQAFLIISGLAALVFFSLKTSNAALFPPLTAKRLFNTSFTIGDLLVLLLTYSVTFVVGPDIYSRIFCAKNELIAKRSILIVALILIPVSFALTWLGIFARQSALPGIIGFAGELLPGWAYGLLAAALLSAVMSSADTTLLTSSIILSELIHGNVNHINNMKHTRIFILIIGVLGIVIALFVSSVIQALLYALTLFSGAFVVPSIFGLLKFKVIKSQVVMTIVTGGIIALSGKIIHDFAYQTPGNIITVSSYFFSILLLIFPLKRTKI
ncbi:MAG: Na+/solute symporter [Draconibacterium sp.]|nr:MAG: Na+/solute symporter [Draconibacterium sp.]PIF05549.1 MAG: Na+/solute symporter [Draconibacterium sp.]